MAGIADHCFLERAGHDAILHEDPKRTQNTVGSPAESTITMAELFDGVKNYWRMSGRWITIAPTSFCEEGRTPTSCPVKALGEPGCHWGFAPLGRVGRTSRRILSRGSFTPAA